MRDASAANASATAHHATRSPRASQDLSGKELQLLAHEHGGDGDGADGGDGGSARDSLIIGSGAGISAGSIAGPQGAETGAGVADAAQGRPDGGAAAEEDGDDGLDDDLMDKISSSPSIEDGAYARAAAFPSARLPTPATPPPRRCYAPSPDDELSSSSPFTEAPAHLPLGVIQEEDGGPPSEAHHRNGGYRSSNNYKPWALRDNSWERERAARPDRSPSRLGRHRVVEELEGSSPRGPDEPADGADVDNLPHLLLPTTDPAWDDLDSDASSDAAGSDSSSADEHALFGVVGPGHDPHGRPSYDGWEPGPTEVFDSDDETEDFSFDDRPGDDRFLDSGWGGECLREAEDIDFEFVYALHTFVATVEGQANAAKGDTMVLLDDSNSYWWLVRVVKDSSIGRPHALLVAREAWLMLAEGYLPAEHIETPLERLARLNKHRNIDARRLPHREPMIADAGDS